MRKRTPKPIKEILLPSTATLNDYIMAYVELEATKQGVDCMEIMRQAENSKQLANLIYLGAKCDFTTAGYKYAGEYEYE